MVEFEPDSLWFETSLTMAAQALKEVKTEYHTFNHSPAQIREGLTKLGVSVTQRESEGVLNVIDSYTTQLGLGSPEGPSESVIRRTLKISDWSIAVAQDIKDAARLELEHQEHVHIDDDFSVLLRYNDEKSIVDFVRTRLLPMNKKNRELWFLALPTQIASNSFSRHLEIACDGIFDFKAEEKEGRIAHYLRVRNVRGKSFDSRWRTLQVSESGEVRMVD